jgi:hypothetical protein
MGPQLRGASIMNAEDREAHYGQPDPFRETALAHARSERAEQGLHATINDPATIARLAAMLTSARRANEISDEHEN